MRISDWSSDVCSSDLPMMYRNQTPKLLGPMLQALAQADPHLQDTPKIFSMLRTSSDSAQRGRVPLLVKPRHLSVFDNAHNARMHLQFLTALHFALGSALLPKAAYQRTNFDVPVG